LLKAQFLLHLSELIRSHRHDWSFLKVVLRRWRGRSPFESGGFPRIGWRRLSVSPRPNQIAQREHVTHSKNRSACARQNVPNLELFEIDRIPSRHSKIAHDVLRKECQYKSDENDQSREPRQTFRIHLAANLRPPVVHSSEISEHRSTDHDEVKMSDDEICI